MLCGVALRTVSKVSTAFVGLDRRGEAMVDQTMLDIVISQLDGTEGDFKVWTRRLWGNNRSMQEEE